MGLAHLPTVAIDPVFACAYTQKIRRFCSMMKNHGGYKINFYGLEGSKVEADETIVVLTEEERQRIYGDLESYAKQFFKHGGNDEAYTIFKKNAIREIRQRTKAGDIWCNPMGNYYGEMAKPVHDGGIDNSGKGGNGDQLQGVPFLVESGIGYDGILGNTHRVFESNAWRHYVYGEYRGWRQWFTNGDFYDTVIPNFYDKNHYTNGNKEDYFFMNCRIAQRKGIHIAIKTVEEMGGHLIIAGQPGEEVKLDSPNVEYIGYVSEKDKIDLLSHAKGLFSPTLYIGPFEGITAEAMMSGCPVITTDFGCYTETVKHGITGFRCNMLKDFVKAAKNIDKIDPIDCKKWAIEQFSMETCAPRYNEFFQRLEDLYKKGWETLE
jgi:glycosyltransferase involved in cell wall biosynthesis